VYVCADYNSVKVSSASRKGSDDSGVSPAVLASHGSVPVINDRSSAAAEQQSLRDCSCTETRRSMSPTHARTHCWLNNVAQAEMTQGQNASAPSYRQRQC